MRVRSSERHSSNPQQEQLKGAGTPVVLDVASAGGEPAITIAKVHVMREHFYNGRFGL